MAKTTKHDEQLNNQKIKLINIMSFLMGFSQAILAYIISSYLSVALGNDNVGIYYFLAYGIVLIALLNFHKVIRRFGKSNVFFTTLGLKILSLFLLILLPPSGLSIIFLMTYIIFGNLDLVSLDIILESFSVDKKSGRIRGLHLMILDAGFLLGPFISTQLLENFNYQVAFLASFMIDVLIMYVAIKKFKKVNHKFDVDMTISDIFKKVFRHKNVLRIYYISFILEFFYALMIIYSPLYLRNLGFSWQQIGLIFTIMLVPFVIFPYPVGIIADKWLGEKEMIILSIFMLGSTTLLFFFTISSSIIVWSMILFLTRIGASIIQTLRDSYFYKKIDGHDVDLINFFRTASPNSYILASFISYLILINYPIKYVFLVLSLVIFSGLYPAIRLVDNKCEKEIKKEKLLKSALLNNQIEN